MPSTRSRLGWVMLCQMKLLLAEIVIIVADNRGSDGAPAWPDRGRSSAGPAGRASPSGLTKCDWVRPSSLARLFIMSTKPSTVPPRLSATTMQASLPDWMMMPRIRSSTGMLRAQFHEHLGALGAPGALGHRQRVGQLDAAVLQALEQQLQGHQLGHGGRRHRHHAVLLPQHLPASRRPSAGACSALVSMAARAGQTAKADKGQKAIRKRRRMNYSVAAY